MAGRKISEKSSGAPAVGTMMIPVETAGGSAVRLALSDLFAPLGYENAVTAHAGGGQALATALSSSAKFHRISTCATAADSVSIGAAVANDWQYIQNDGVAAAQIFSASTINGVAGSTGISLPAGVGAFFLSTANGAWITTPIIDFLKVVLTTGAVFSGQVSVPSLLVTGATGVSVAGTATFSSGVSVAGTATFSSGVTVSGALNASGAINGSTATLTGTVYASKFKASAGIPATANSSSAMTATTTDLAGMQIDHSHSASVTFTIPTTTAVAFDTGAVMILTQQSAGQVTVTGYSGVTVVNVNSHKKTQGVNSVTFVQKVSGDRWNLVGATGA